MPPYLSVKQALTIAHKLGIRTELKGHHYLFYIPGQPPISSPMGRDYWVSSHLSKALVSYQEVLSSNSSSSHLMLAAGTALSTKTSTRLGSPPSNSSAPSPPPVLPSSSSGRTQAAKKISPTSPSSAGPAASSAPPPSPSSPAAPSPSAATSLTPPGATPTRSTPPPRSSTGRAYLSSLETWGTSSPATPAPPSSASGPPPAPTSTTSSESKESPSTKESRIPAGYSSIKDWVANRLEGIYDPSPSSAPTTQPSSSGTQRPSIPSQPTSDSSSSGSKAPSPSSPSRPSSPPSHPRSSSMSGSSIRKLTQPEFYKLCEYLKGRKQDLESNSYSLPAIAEQAAAALKLPISKSSIPQALDAVSIKVKEHSRSYPANHLVGSIRTLARAHVQLCRDLGNHCPPEIELLAQE